MNIVWFGSSLVSAYWNGAATYYRGIIRALHERGHRVQFFEPDAFDRQKHRDMDEPEWARVHVYPADRDGVERALAAARGADLVVKASGVGVFDELLEAAVLDLQGPQTLVAFWDVDAPATLDRVHANPADPFGALIPHYDLVLTYGGGAPVVSAYEALGARRCVPIYNALDPTTHFPVAPQPLYQGVLAFLGNRLPDREARVEQLFLHAAAAMPDQRFVMGGNGWHDKPMPANVAYLGHVYTREHNAFNCSPRAVLNINRDSMARYGFSPPTRVFEAAGAGACLITDAWEGIEYFLEPGKEVLVASTGDEIVEHLRALTDEAARAMGVRARERMLAQHTYAHRAADVEAVLGIGTAASSASAWQPATAHRVDAADAADAAPGPASARTAGDKLDIVILGLSITSSWGNGHATTYRALVRALCERGHRVLFLERDMPWYASARDLPEPPYGKTALYSSLDELERCFGREVAAADLVIVGSYVPEGILVGGWVTRVANGLTAFYDIDTPVTLATLEDGSCAYLSPDLIARYDLYLSFTGGPTLERVQRQYGAPRALPLYCAVDPGLHVPLSTSRDTDTDADAGKLRWDLGYMGTYSRDRQPMLQTLLVETAQRWPAGRFVVAGPQYPRSIHWPNNVARVDHLPACEHSSFYGAQRFTLNITRQDMVKAGFSPSVRLFEAAACATPIISDSWPGLETFFELGSEILVAQSPDEVLRYVRDMPEHERLAMGQRARTRVLAEHTAAHRAEALERYVRDARNAPRTRRAATARFTGSRRQRQPVREIPGEP